MSVWWWTFGEVPELPAPEVERLLQELEGREESGEKGRVKVFDTEKDEETAFEVEEIRLVDVRTEGEHEGGHIRGAVSCSMIPPWSLRARLEALNLPKDPHVLIICICLSAHRSIAAVKLLREMGHTNVVQLAGGMQAWRAERLPEVRPPS